MGLSPPTAPARTMAGRLPGSRMLALLALALLVLTAAAIIAHTHAGYALQDRDAVLAGASAAHPAGTDELGRDRLVRIAAALLLSCSGAAAAALLATVLAIGIGTLAAFAHRSAGAALLYVADLFLTLPWLFLLMTVRAALPLTLSPAASATLTFVLLGLLGWPAFARIHHARVRAMRHAGWMQLGRATGLRPAQLLRTHLLPQLAPLALSQFLIYMPACVMAEANLGALGLGIREPLPSWGAMLQTLADSALLSRSAWLYVPMALLVVTLLLLEHLAMGDDL